VEDARSPRTRFAIWPLVGEQRRVPAGDVAGAAGAVLGVASLVLYAAAGYSTGMLLLWLAALVLISVFAWARNPGLPRIRLADLLASVGLAVAFAPIYLIGLYRNPIQVTKIAAFFMEQMDGNAEVRGRFLKVRNPGQPCVAGGGGGGGVTSFTYSLSLIK